MTRHLGDADRTCISIASFIEINTVLLRPWTSNLFSNNIYSVADTTLKDHSMSLQMTQFNKEP